MTKADNGHELYERTIRAWGKAPQILQVVEEMAELTKEIIKNVNRHQDNLGEIIEETADVEIMLKQLKCCYNINDQVDSYKSEKLKAIEKRLNEWEKEHK